AARSGCAAAPAGEATPPAGASVLLVVTGGVLIVFSDVGSIGQAGLDPPAVQPLERVVEALGRAALPQVVADQPLHALRVVDPAHLARGEHDARGAGDARALV